MPIIILGKASQTKQVLPVEENDLELSLLFFLQRHKIPVASSCRGIGVCRKCIFNDELLCCEILVSEAIDKNLTMTLDYL